MPENNCNDCLDLTSDFCQGEKMYTQCIITQNGIPYLNISDNEQLDVTVIKLVNAIQALTARIIALENA